MQSFPGEEHDPRHETIATDKRLALTNVTSNDASAHIHSGFLVTQSI